MWGRVYPHVILLLLANIFKASCEGTSSLTFVIDDTGSMHNDIDQVKISANKIMDIVFNEKSSLINDMVLVTVNDPDSQLRVVTKERSTFKKALDAVYAHNIANYDCWEPSMKGLLLALEKSRPGSYLYVFTDATAKDYADSAAVIDMCHKKQSQITFVLTGQCYGIQKRPFKVYYEIADACSGLAFYVKKDEVNQVLRTLKETITGNKTVLATRTVPPGVYTDIPFTIDEHTDYAIVSVSGKSVSLTITGPAANKEKIMWNNNGKVIKLSDAVPGKYVATVRGQSSTSVVIVGRTDFLFSHGFSELEPKKLSDTTTQPIADANVHLTISVTDPKHEVRIDSAQILQMDEKLIKELPLRDVSSDFYITRPFVAPSQIFKVAVKGTVKTTGKPVTRIAKIPVTPQKPPKNLPNKTKPTANIEEGTSIQVEYGSTVKLTCKVTAYPKPKITWSNSKGDTLPSSDSVFQYPYEYISYMTISNALKADKYKCNTANDEGNDSKTINVNVKDPLVVKTTPAETTKVVYGSEGTITCDVRSALSMHIVWYYKNEKTAESRQIVTSDKHWISPDGTQLKIKKMDLDLVGTYTCKASLINFKDVQKAYSTLVKIDGLTTPKVTGASDKKVLKGATAVLECNIVNGLPKPKITWQFMDKVGSKFTPIAGSENVLRILNVEDKHAGRYKCVAENIIGRDKHITTLIIQELPKITSSLSTVYQSIEGKALLKIPCISAGLPKPVITWKLHGRTITPNAKYSTEDEALVIRSPKVSDTNSYTCEATNEVGSVSATFQTRILQIPKLSGVPVKKVRKGTTFSIECMIVKGEPKPKITWLFMENSGSMFVPIAGSDNILHITSAENKHAGRYKCVAQNDVGSDDHETTLIVESPPVITNSLAVVEGLEGDIALRIPCDVVGVPPPVITWKLNGAAITPNAKYSIENGALVIMNPSKKDSNTSYVCEAKNYISSVSATFKANVENELNDYGVEHHVYLLEGETRKLDCEALRSKSQSVKWFINGISITANTPYVEVADATSLNDGNYTCRVSDKHGHIHTHTYVVDVGRPPILGEETPVDDWRGDISDILSNCESNAKPVADVEWKFNGEVLTDQNVTVLGIYYQWGHYSCNVSNVHGSVQRSFDVKSSTCLISKNFRDAQHMPLLLTDDLSWPNWETTKHYSVVEPEEKITLSCPNLKDAPNAFQKFPKQNELKAYCYKQDLFSVDGTFYKISDLHCSHSIKPTVVRKKVKCLTDTSELIRVGYNVAGFLETYEVCFDHAKNMPLYTRVLMTETDKSLNAAHNWYKYPGIGDGKLDKRFTCEKLLSPCCYSKSQLVNARDFKDNPAKYSTFIDSLNAIPLWRPCYTNQTTWEDVDEMVRSRIATYDEFIAWSGTHTFQEKDGAIIPRFLWKVLRFDQDASIAIVHVNDPSPTDKDIKCKKNCMKDWFKPVGNYTYCCELSEFLEAFDLQGTDIGESLDKALGKIEDSSYVN